MQCLWAGRQAERARELPGWLVIGLSNRAKRHCFLGSVETPHTHSPTERYQTHILSRIMSMTTSGKRSRGWGLGLHTLFIRFPNPSSTSVGCNSCWSLPAPCRRWTVLLQSHLGNLLRLMMVLVVLLTATQILGVVFQCRYHIIMSHSCFVRS